jgi:hypothetical protein
MLPAQKRKNPSVPDRKEINFDQITEGTVSGEFCKGAPADASDRLGGPLPPGTGLSAALVKKDLRGNSHLKAGSP